MKQFLINIPFLFISVSLYGQTVTAIAADYHDGQIFLTWNNIPNVDSGFYYVYRNTVAITAANIQSSTYLGRVPFNFSYDFRLTESMPGNLKHYLITNDNPLTILTESQNLFVLNCTNDNEQAFFAVRSDYGNTGPNWTVSPGDNATIASITQHLDPIRAYLQGIIDPVNNKDEKMEVYIHYGGKEGTESYPAMANEGCLPFHFGIIKTGAIGGNNSCHAKFHAGDGNFIMDHIGTKIDDAWKVSFDDWIPAYNFNADGSNTRWLGYHKNLDIYNYTLDTDFPASGSIRAYTFFRIEWELKWIRSYWPGTIDSTRIYLAGNSQGCGGVLLHCLVYPEKYAGGTLTDPKFNLDAVDDHNPDCKYNEDHSGKNTVRILFGNEDVVNLKTDIPKKQGGTVFYKVFDLTNMNNMFNTQKNKPLPFILSISGKNDENTCWEEKPSFFESVEKTKAGGIYYWDLRGHSGGFNAWPPLKTTDLSRFSTNKSYPAFSNCELDGNPGSAINPDPPYFSGDDTGSLHGNIDWVDSTLLDQVASWQVQLYILQAILNDDGVFPEVLPSFTKSDVSIRRAQNFKGFAEGTQFSWYNIRNGDTIQSGIVTQNYQGAVPKPITVKKVKVYPDGNVLRVIPSTLKPSAAGEAGVIAETSYSVYPNPLRDQFTLNLNTEQKSDVLIEVFNLFGEKLLTEKTVDAEEGQHSFRFYTSSFQPGIYLVKVTSSIGQHTFKIVKE